MVVVKITVIVIMMSLEFHLSPDVLFLEYMHQSVETIGSRRFLKAYQCENLVLSPALLQLVMAHNTTSASLTLDPSSGGDNNELLTSALENLNLHDDSSPSYRILRQSAVSENIEFATGAHHVCVLLSCLSLC
jgi:hypothetical protein